VSGQLAFSMITSGDFHTCALTDAGTAYCWGKGGRIGNAIASCSRQPSAVVGAGSYKMISAGQDHTCGVLLGGSALCWGLNPSGELGDGTIADKLAPSRVGGTLAFQAISAGGGFTCGLVTGGASYCWGYNSAGQLGLGAASFANESLPRPTTGGLFYSSISTGGYHACAISVGGTVLCWGNNTFGELGLGRTSPSGRERAPVTVFVP
jgi:alpha-tubulin suppressor-like RCC1 family protein